MLKKRFVAAAQFIGALLAATSFFLMCFSAFARIDTPADRVFFWVWDVMLGLPLAAAIVLLCMCKKRTLMFAAIGWILVSASLLLWHEHQVRVRWAVPDRIFALNQLTVVRVALDEYANDCGEVPPQSNGLTALITDPGVMGWAGPYLEVERLTDPWGNPVQYKAYDSWVEVWSNGPDGQSDTNDDIRADDIALDQVPG